MNEITIIKAVDATRKQDFDTALALARQVLSENSSTQSCPIISRARPILHVGPDESDGAGKEFRRAVELGPGLPDSWLTYIQYLVQTKHVDQAKTAIEAARKALPADRATLTLAQCCLIVGDPEQAESLIQGLLKDKPQDPAALRLAAGLYFGQNRLDKAGEYLDKLDRVASISSDDKAWANRTRTALLLNTRRHADRDQALGLIEQNLKTNPESVEDQILKATILAVRPGRHAEAVKILEELGSANRLDANHRFLLAQLLTWTNAPKKSTRLRCSSSYADLKARSLTVQLAHFVNYWIGRNQLEQADRWLAELTKAEPKGVAALELEARVLDLRKRKPELLALLEARAREVPDQIEFVADVLNRYGFLKEAEAAYKAFIACDHNQPERVLALANFLARQDRVTEAMAILNDAWSTCRPEQFAYAALLLFHAASIGEADKRQIEAWVAAVVRKRSDAIGLATSLGAIWIFQGRFDEAESLYRRVLHRNPENSDALNGLAWLLALRDRNDTKEALALIDHAISAQGSMPSLVDTRGVVLIQAGQTDKAVLDLTRAKDSNVRNPNFALHLAWAYQASGQIEKARMELQKAKTLGLKPRALDPLMFAIFQRLQKELSSGCNKSHLMVCRQCKSSIRGSCQFRRDSDDRVARTQ